MKRILIASALILGTAGFAAAENPVLYEGNYSASVLNQYGAEGAAETQPMTDTMPTASISNEGATAQEPAGNYADNVTKRDVNGR